jgi:hypothetical protein
VQRLDALLLVNDDTVIAAVRAVVGVAAGIGPFPDVVALEIGAGRQDDIGEAGLGAPPAVLG